MFIFTLLIALVVLFGLIIFMMIEMNEVEGAGNQYLLVMKRLYGDEPFPVEE